MYLQLSPLQLEFLPFLNKAHAYRKYGQTNVESWLENKLIPLNKNGDHSASWRIDRIEAHSLSKASSLKRFL